MGSDFEVEYLI